MTMAITTRGEVRERLRDGYKRGRQGAERGGGAGAARRGGGAAGRRRIGRGGTAQVQAFEGERVRRWLRLLRRRRLLLRRLTLR